MSYGVHRFKAELRRTGIDPGSRPSNRQRPFAPCSQLIPNERWIIRSLILVMLIVAFPSKFLYLLGPPLFAALMFWKGTLLSLRRFLILGISLLGVSTLALLIDHYSGQTVSFFGMFFWFLTHMPILIVLSVRPDARVSSELIDRVVVFVAVFTIVQATVCLIPLFFMLKAGHINGDLVSGTFGILDWFGGVTINHVFFTLCMFCLLVFLWPFRKRYIVKVALLAGAPVTILAQTGHQTFFFLISIMVMTLVGNRSPFRVLVSIIGSGFIGALLLGIFLLASPATFEVTSMWFNKVVNSEGSPKRMVLDAVADAILTPKVAILGTGLGQFSSRAALFACGWYAPGKIPSPLISITDRTMDHLVPALIQHEVAGENSSIAQPMFSFISLPVEAGFLITLLFGAAVWSFWLQALFHARSTSPERAHFGRYLVFFVVFLSLSCTIENYLEFVQGLFLPLTLCMLCSARAKSVLRQPRI